MRRRSPKGERRRSFSGQHGYPTAIISMIGIIASAMPLSSR
jgi:hypothetical protein